METTVHKWHRKFAKLMDNKSYQPFDFFTLLELLTTLEPSETLERVTTLCVIATPLLQQLAVADTRKHDAQLSILP